MPRPLCGRQAHHLAGSRATEQALPNEHHRRDGRYRSAYFRCKFDGDKVPLACAIQTLVQAWKEMRG